MSRVHSRGHTVHSQTFLSGAISLDPGEVAFVDATTEIVFPSVDGNYTITRFYAEIVDEHGASVPLDEAYLHHWLVFNPPDGNDGICGGMLGYTFGVGAESRNTAVQYPDGYGLHTDGSQLWTTNIHLFRTQGLKVGHRGNYSQALKECIECFYAPEGGKGHGCTTQWSGTFQCCFDGSHCPTDGSVSDKKDYFFKYTIDWTTDNSALKPIHVYVLDASDCRVEYNIDANDGSPVSVTELSWESEVDGDIVFGVGHIHNAGINTTVSRNGVDVCTTVPVYGTEVGVPGNEKGYLTAAPPCIMHGEENKAGFRVEAGDVITLRANYWVGTGVDPTGSGLPGGFHGGVMALFYLGVDATSLRNSAGQPVQAKDVAWKPLTKAIVM